MKKKKRFVNVRVGKVTSLLVPAASLDRPPRPSVGIGRGACQGVVMFEGVYTSGDTPLHATMFDVDAYRVGPPQRDAHLPFGAPVRMTGDPYL